MNKLTILTILLWIIAVNSLSANTVTVTSNGDSGPGTLRQTVTNAIAGDTIDFNLSYPDTITLTSGEIAINVSAVILGPGSDSIVISGNGASRIFMANDDIEFIGLSMQDGFQTGSGNYGAAVFTGFSAQNLSFEDCVFSNNVQATTVGGALSIYGAATFTNCEFHNNQAQGGAALQVADGGDISIINCSFYDNNSGSGNGGAIRCNYADISIVNSTFSNNQSNAGGGAINYNCGGCMGFGPAKEMNIVNCTFSDNSATIGNEIQVQDFSGDVQIRLMNTIIHNSTGGNNFVSNSNNLSDGGNICSDSTMMSFLNSLGDQNGVDPLLFSLGENGGMTKTIMLDCSSPAYNAGLDAGAPSSDQRGMSRHNTTDVGALEVQPEYGIDTRAECNSLLWIDGNTYTEDNDTAIFNIQGGAMNGCDSVVTLNLTINDDATGIDSRAACDQYTWIDGNTYTTNNNTATFNIPGGAINGCDSLVTLNLTLDSAASGIDVRTACNQYTWIDGNTYSADNNTATFTIQGGAVNGCDSLVRLELIINTVDNAVTLTGSTLFSTDTTASHQWLDCNNGFDAVSGETNSSFTPQTSGSYAVVVSQNGCVDTSACRSVSITTVGIAESSFNKSVSVYPNPTQGKITLDLGELQPEIIVTIRDLMGRLIKTEQKINTSAPTIYLNGAPGIYLVEVQNHQGKTAYFPIIME